MSVTLRDYLAMSVFPREQWIRLTDEEKQKLGNDVYDMADRLIQIRQTSTKPVETYPAAVAALKRERKADKPFIVPSKEKEA